MKTYEMVILFILKNPKQKININQIARKINRAPSGVFKELRKMEREKIVFKERIGNSVVYDLDMNNMEAKKLLELALIKEKKEMAGRNPYINIISRDIAFFEKYADIIILFGSITKKKEFRDIDIFIVSKQRFINEIESACRKLSRLYDKNVSPLIASYSDFVDNIKKQDKVITEIIRTGILLKGYDKFIEAIRDGKI